MRPSTLTAGLAVAIAAVALGIGIVKEWPREQAAATRQAPQETETQSPMIGRTRPAFAMPDVSGRQRSIKEWDGKVLAVNFWATWCEPCKEEIPAFNSLQRQYAAQGVQFVGVALDDLDAVQTFLKTRTIAYPVLIGEDQAAKVADTYGDDQGVVPYTAFVNRKGQIAFIQYGAMSPDLARQVIESLL